MSNHNRIKLYANSELFVQIGKPWIGDRRFLINPESKDIIFHVMGSGDDSLLTTNPTNNTVGIGTSDPKQKLDINGAIKIGNPDINTGCNSNTVGTIQYKNITDGGALSVCVRTSGIPPAYQWINIVVATGGNINSMISVDQGRIVGSL